MNINIKDKVVVVTGSSRGIGRAIIRKLALEGAKVVINYKSDHKQAEELIKEINSINEKAIIIQADVSKEMEVKKLYDKTIEHFGKVDVLINNAGISQDDYLYFMNYRKWKNVIDNNLDSVYLCSRYFSKDMIKRNKGKIINIASLKGQLGSEGQCNYSASKAGVIGLTKSLSKELGKANISVNAICPGFIVTDLNKDSKKKKDIADKMCLLGNDYTLDDLLNFIVLMVSDNIRGVSGQVFNVDSRLI